MYVHQITWESRKRLAVMFVIYDIVITPRYLELQRH